MSFNWAGAAEGANRSLHQLLAERRAEFLQREQLKILQEASERANRQLEATLAATKEQTERSRRDQQLQEAAISLQQADAMGQGSELNPDVAGLLRATPYGARV